MGPAGKYFTGCQLEHFGTFPEATRWLNGE